MTELKDEEREYYSLVMKVFDILAPFYDIVVMPLTRLRGEVVDYTGAKKGSTILDVATGTGKQAFAFAKRGYDVTGVDLSEGMVRVANRKNRYKNAKFQVADATSLPFGDNGFDVVSVSFALHTMPPTVRQEVLKEMVRVTRRAGTMVIVDFALPLNRIGKYLVYDLVKAPMGKHFIEFTHSDLDGLLKESGIEIREERRAILGAVRILKGLKVETRQTQNLSSRLRIYEGGRRMVKTVRRGGKTLYICEICGLAYKEKGWADKCESWCREHEGSCNLEVAGHAEPTSTQE